MQSRISPLECLTLRKQFGDICHTHNDLMDAYNNHEDEIKRMSANLADLEDHLCRNNIKFRGIPNAITQPLLHHFLHQLLSELLPSASDMELLIDSSQNS